MHDPAHDDQHPSTPRELVAAKYAEDLFAQFGLNLYLVLRVLIIALVSGMAAAVIDEVLDLPASVMFLTAGGLVGALNGATYACFKGCYDRSGLVLGIVGGWLATFTWYVTLKIIAPESVLLVGLDWLEASVTGLVAGAVGFGWYTLIHLLPRRFVG